MAQWHGVSKRKPSGGRKRMMRGKRRTEISSEKQFAVLGQSKRKKYRKTGALTRIKVLSDDIINVNNPKVLTDSLYVSVESGIGDLLVYIVLKLSSYASVTILGFLYCSSLIGMRGRVKFGFLGL